MSNTAAVLIAALFAFAIFSGAARAACSPKVYVYGSGTAVSAAAREETRALAKKQLAELCEFYDYDFEKPVRVVMTQGDAAFEREAGDGAPSWATAIAGRRLVVIRNVSASFAAPQFESTLKHELSHVVLAEMFARAPEALPHWLNEGLAMNASGEWEMPETWTNGKADLYSALRSGEALDFEEISGSFPYSEWKARIAYAQSLHFTNYLLKRFGQEKVVSLLKKLSAGVPFEKAFHSATGEDFGDAVEYWKAKVAGKSGLTLLFIALAQLDTWIWFLMALLVVAAFVRYMFKRRTGGGGFFRRGRSSYDDWDDDPDYDDDWDEEAMGHKPWRPGRKDE